MGEKKKEKDKLAKVKAFIDASGLGHDEMMAAIIWGLQVVGCSSSCAVKCATCSSGCSNGPDK